VLLTVLIASLHASAATPPTLSIEGFSIKAGETKELLVDLNNPDDQIANVQFLLNLPTGLTVAQKEGKSLITLTNRASGGHQVMDNPSSGMVMVYSMPVAAFSGTSGAILSISLTAGTGFVGGNVALRSIVLATEQGGQYKPDDVVYTIENKVPVTGITLNATSQELNAGQTFQLSATVAPSNATNKSVKWSSNKTSVATVSSTGVVTAVAAGSATITCEAEDGSGVMATCNITVKPILVTEIILNATNLELTVGQTFQLKKTLVPSKVSWSDVKWSSNNTSVATVVDAHTESGAMFVTGYEGLVEARAPGSATITCSAMDGSGVTATCQVTVKAASESHNIQFADAEVKRICVENWDTNGDGELSETEAAAVESVGSVFKDAEITSFNEFRYFTGVTAISFGTFDRCKLTSIILPNSVKRLSQNSFFQCHQLVSVTFPDNDGFSFDISPFRQCHGLVSVNLPKNLTCMENNPFSNCVSLVEINVNDENPYYKDVDGIVYTKDGKALIAYPCAKDLEVYTIIEGAEIIGTDAFNGSNQLKAIHIPQSVSIIKNGAFYGCEGLRTIALPTELEEVSRYLFEGCKSLKNIIIPENVTKIGISAFYGCGIEKITIPSKVTSIGERAFRECYQLTEVWSNIDNAFAISDDVFSEGTFSGATLYVPAGSKAKYQQAAGWKNFQNIVEMETDELQDGDVFTSLTIEGIEMTFMVISAADKTCQVGSGSSGSAMDRSIQGTVTIPSEVRGLKVTKISTAAFYACSISEILLPSTLTTIDVYAMGNCRNLTSMSIPASVSNIGALAFGSDSNLKSFTVESGNMSFSSRDGLLLNKEGNKLLYYPPGLTEEFSVYDYIVEIGNYAFAECSLPKLIVPITVKSAGFALAAASELKSVEWASTANIPGRAFDDCWNLTGISINDVVTSIGNEAFSGCSHLAEIIIPGRVSAIGSAAFEDCKNIERIVSNIVSPFPVDDNTFSVYEKATLFVPYGCKATYQQVAGWKNFQNIVEMEPASPNIQFADAEVKRICVLNWDTNGDGELSEAEAAAVTSIKGFGANSKITSFNELQYFTGLKSISVNAFERCNSLAEVTMPQQITAIDENAFDACTSLTSVVIPENVTYIGETAFSRCSGLTSIHIPDKVNTIARGAFDACSSLPSITIPASVVSIGELAFDRCTALKSVYALSEAPYGFPSNVFRSSTYQQATLYVPAGTKAKYQSTGGWQNFANIKEIGVTEPELVLTDLTIEGDGIVGSLHHVSVTIRNEGGDFSGNLYLHSKTDSENKWNPYPTQWVIPQNGQKTQNFTATFTTSDTFRLWVSTDEAGNDRLGDVVPWTVTPAAVLTAKNYTREYGEENPDFGFTADKGGFSGTPKISCTADRYSDVGTYPIIIEQGSVDNNYVTYVKGTLTITKAPLTVKAQDCLSRQGLEPAGITPKYENFKNGEDKSVLTKEPQFTTTATAESPMGSVHQLTFSGAEAKNYAFNYIPGTITIIGRPGDVNRDSYINTTDAVDVIQQVLGYDVLPHIFDGDLYRDDEITTADVQQVVSYILNDDRAAARRTAPATSSNSRLGLTIDEQGRLAVTLQNDMSFTGLQFDVTLPEDADLSQVLLSDQRRNGHSVAMRQMDDGSYRVLVYSMQNTALRGSDGMLATLLTSAIDGDVVLSNIHVVDEQCADHRLPDVSLSMLTGISTLTEDTAPFDIYDLNGRLVRRDATSTKGLHRGVYMINNQKVVIK